MYQKKQRKLNSKVGTYSNTLLLNYLPSKLLFHTYTSQLSVE